MTATISPVSLPDRSSAGVDLVMLTGDELAALMRFSGVTTRFRAWCREMEIRTVPGRANLYDLKHVRQRLDRAQGIIEGTAPGNVDSPPLSLVEQRRMRRGTS